MILLLSDTELSNKKNTKLKHFILNLGLHFARIHDEEIRRPTNPDVPGLPLAHALRLHKDLGKSSFGLKDIHWLD